MNDICPVCGSPMVVTGMGEFICLTCGYSESEPSSNSQSMTQPIPNVGWVCPHCCKVNAPSLTTCSC
jgi:tRNA(Ile2) C34 agmatinyltransferase TiaS